METAVVILVFATLAFGENGGQLPQLMNADGTLSGASAPPFPSAMPTRFPYENYYFASSPQQPSAIPPQPSMPPSPSSASPQSFTTSDGFAQLRNAANTIAAQFHTAGDALSNASRSWASNVDQFRQQMSQSFEGAVNNGLTAMNGGFAKLKEIQFPEKYRPLIDAAIEIFEKPGTEKQHWNELVERVEATNLNEPEKQELYQKIANATAPQSPNP